MAASLVACGGGGGDGDTQSTSTLTFNLESAYKALIASGQTANFKITASNSLHRHGHYHQQPSQHQHDLREQGSGYVNHCL